MVLYQMAVQPIFQTGEIVSKSESRLFGVAPGKIISRSHYFGNGVVIDEKDTDRYSIHLADDSGNGIHENKCSESSTGLHEAIKKAKEASSEVAKIQCNKAGYRVTLEMNVRELESYLKRMKKINL